MAPTARQLNRATLHRQLLGERSPMSVEAAVGHLLALQAQEPSSPYLALWSRLRDFDPSRLDEAFEAGRLVRCSLLRLTLHAVTAGDHRWLHPLMAPSLRSSRLRDRRYLSRGLTDDDADGVLPRLLAHLGEARTSAEVEQHLGHLGSPDAEWVWWALRRFAPIVDAPTGGPWSFGQPRGFLAFEQSGPDERPASAAAELVVRYLRAFGPATMADIEQFTILRRPVVSAAVTELGDQLVSRGGTGARALLDVTGATLPGEDTPAPVRLLPMWDNALLAYKDRSRVIPDEQRPLVIRRNGDVLPTVLVDGSVAGVWRAVDGGIEISPFLPLDDDTWAEAESEAAALWTILCERDVTIHRRFAHWWDKDIPAGHRRLLGRPDPG